MTNAIENQQQRQVTLVGYGKYGKLITNKYMATETLCCLATVIDPSFHKDSQQVEDFALRTSQQPKVRVFATFESWYKDYWMQLSDDERAMVVVDVAVKPDICFGVVSKFVQHCTGKLRWMILPKPIVETKDEIRGLVEMLRLANIQAVVASQWAYSSLPSYIETKLKEHTTAPLREVILNFTKENGHSYGTHPPLLEVPHCLQLLHSTHMVNYHDTTSPSWPVERHVTGTEDCVSIRYHLANGLTVIVKSDLDYKPTHQERQQGANAARSDYQIRTMTAIDESGQAALEADFWVHFDRKGRKVLREGSVVCQGEEDDARPVREDQLGNMLQQIFRYIERSEDPSEASCCILDVKTYQSIAEEIMIIEAEWKLHVKSSSGFEHKYQLTKRRPSLDLRMVVSSQA